MNKDNESFAPFFKHLKGKTDAEVAQIAGIPHPAPSEAGEDEIPQSFKDGMADVEAGRLVDMELGMALSEIEAMTWKDHPDGTAAQLVAIRTVADAAMKSIARRRPAAQPTPKGTVVVLREAEKALVRGVDRNQHSNDQWCKCQYCTALTSLRALLARLESEGE
jgi:hypothetical protein